MSNSSFTNIKNISDHLNSLTATNAKIHASSLNCDSFTLGDSQQKVLYGYSPIEFSAGFDSSTAQTFTFNKIPNVSNSVDNNLTLPIGSRITKVVIENNGVELTGNGNITFNIGYTQNNILIRYFITNKTKSDINSRSVFDEDGPVLIISSKVNSITITSGVLAGTSLTTGNILLTIFYEI